MVDIHHSSTANAPAKLFFDYVDDYRNVPEWMFGLSKFAPTGDKDHGLGATFDGSMKLGPKTLHSTVECTGWEEGKLISLKSIKGFVNSSTWHFKPLSEDTSELSVDFNYELPGGLAGKALGRVIEPFISIAIKHTETTLREKVEALHAKQKG